MGADLLPSPTVEDFTAKGGWWVVAQGLLLAALVAAWVLWGVGWGVAAVAGGAVLAGAGGALGAGGFLALGRDGDPLSRASRRRRPGGSAGPIAWSGTPSTGASCWARPGCPWPTGTGPAWCWRRLLAALFRAKSGFEERRLAARFPGYGAYRERVRRRLIPWIL